MPLNIDTVRPYICLDCIAGSKAYGLDTPTSDDDFKGVFLAPLPLVLAGLAPPLVQDEKHDRQYTELETFCRELELNNSGALELLACVGGEQELFCAPWLKTFLGKYQFLSRKCYYTYLANARRQLKRIAATHDKAAEPEPLPAIASDFALVVEQGKPVPLTEWLSMAGLNLQQLAARRVSPDENLYVLYRHASRYGLFGKDGTGVSCPQIPDAAEPLGNMLFRAEAYAQQNRRCAQYREWAAKRNPARLVTSVALSAEQGLYDVKHMSHVFRLLHTAEEIAREGKIHVRRTWDNEFLRKIKAGQLPLQDLVQRAEEKMAALKPLFEQSDLPEEPQTGSLRQDLAELRIRLHDEGY